MFPVMFRVVGIANVISPLQLNVMVSPALSVFAWAIAASRLDESTQELTVMVDAAYVGRGELIPAIPSARSTTISIQSCTSSPYSFHSQFRLVVIRPRGCRVPRDIRHTVD